MWASISSTVRGTWVISSIPSAVTMISSSMRTYIKVFNTRLFVSSTHLIVGIECAVGHVTHVTGIYFYQNFGLINPPYRIYLYCSKRIIQQFVHKLSSNKKLSSKFLCEDKLLSISKQETFCFSNKKSSGESSVALRNPSFCWDTFLTDTI